ncbi:hypothetical protein B0H12DRAFT_1237408 [Mycena haematopus]|nr:hypothetical protein B0H12DRAFT_1237408 [Mycena haematopus]
MEEDIDSASLKRCSTCKNRFYCSAQCQKNDWKGHKWNCSVLPVDGLPAATVVEIDDQFKTAVKGVVAVLKEVADASKDDKKGASKSMLAPLLRIPSELPPSLHYNRAVEDSAKYPYRLPIVTACRVLLIDYISALDAAQRQEYEKFLDSMQGPMDYCELYGPKIVGRPADLSPGEYAMLVQVMPAWIVPRQMAKAPEKGENPDAGREWVWLAVVSRRAYSAAGKS